MGSWTHGFAQVPLAPSHTKELIQGSVNSSFSLSSEIATADGLKALDNGGPLYRREGLKTVESEEAAQRIKRGEPLKGFLLVGDLDLEGVGELDNQVVITDSVINGSANFDGVTFKNSVDMSNTLFRKDASFKGSQFDGKASLSGTKFLKNCDFWRSHFLQKADFAGAKFEESARFQEVYFEGDASFQGAGFGRDANFKDAQFLSEAFFWLANFSRDAEFHRARFAEDADFSEASFGGSFYLIGAKFERLIILYNLIKDKLKADSSAYRSLAKSYRDLELFKDADGCYYDYRTLNRKQAERKGAWLELIPDYFIWLSCGYGVKPAYTIAWAVLMILAFGIVFWNGNGIKKGLCPQTPAAGAPISFKDALYFSTMVFITASADFRPVGPYRYAVTLERVLGWLLLALFFITLVKVTVR